MSEYEDTIDYMRKRDRGAVVVILILASVLSLATRTTASSPLDTMGDLAAHRGGADLYPENTLTAFKAIQQDMPGVVLEFDVMAIKDGTLVISHDKTVDRVSNTKGKVANMTRAQWSALRINHPQGGASAPASTLEEVLDEFAGTDVPMFIELKDNTVADRFIETLWPHREQIVVASFIGSMAERLAKSGLHTMHLSGGLVEPLDGVEYVGFSNTNITKAYVDTHDVEVWAWGDDVTADMADADTRGIDGYVTNNPNGWTRAHRQQVGQ